MNVTIIGAGNSGLAMAAHLTQANHQVTLWNRTAAEIPLLMKTGIVYAGGAIEGKFKLYLVTDNLEKALDNPDIILVTTPAHAHKELAKKMALTLKRESLIVLNPGRTFGALEFEHIFKEHNSVYKQKIAETQTIIYTCRKIADNQVDVISLKSNVLLSTFDANKNQEIITNLPEVLQEYFSPAKSMIETSIGNVGMVLHCAPLLLNTGWTESKKSSYLYYYDGITPSIANFIEKLDQERLNVSKALGLEVESTQKWLERTYNLQGKNFYETIQKNESYQTIDAPESLYHRYIFEDIPCGLVPLASIGEELGLEMKITNLVIELATELVNTDFRKKGRNLKYILKDYREINLRKVFNRSDD